MKIISKLLKTIKNLIFVDEFDEIYKSATTRTIFVLYCCCGGFCFHNNVRTRFRKVWIIFNILNSCLFYLFHLPTNDYYAWLLPAPVMLGVLDKIFYYLWVFLSVDFLPKLIDFFDNSPTDGEGVSASLLTVHVKKPQAKLISGICCFIFLCTMTTSLGNYFCYENYFVHHYPTYFPFEKTIVLYIAIRSLQTITIIPELIIFLSAPTLIIMITINIYSRFELLGLFLRRASYSVFLQMDEASNMELAMDEKRIPSSLSRIQEVKIRKALALDELTSKIIIAIERHQKLINVSQCVKQMEYVLFTPIHAQVFIQSIILAFFISSITKTAPFHLLFQLTAILCALLLIWLLFCFIGEMFQNMNQIIAMEIYDSPWYLLEPKDRRLVHTFLTIIQRPISITIYGLHPVNFCSFPNTLNTIYSQVQILRTLQLNRQIHHN
ncbi:uncharacterized protein Or71a [Planococcus citri]|uniref:uncharacterized protein Or71a n=1 Tax=Planococcus citri TaxID=170843 RepID=UPI0031F72343